MSITGETRRRAELLAGLTEPYLTMEQAAARAGLDLGQVTAIWTAAGLPTPEPDDPALGDGDVEILRAVGDLQASGLAEPDLVLQLARVSGRHLRRIADAQISAARNRAAGDDLTDHVRHTVPILERTIVHLWRRHLADAATRSLLDWRHSGDELAICFVDLVGFTARSQQLDDEALAALVSAFEDLATTVITRHTATLVKTIGDEVLFVHQDSHATARTAMELVEHCDQDQRLPVARGGIAWGTPLIIGGGYFGPSVNLASRITQLALPNTVLADPALATQLRAHHDITTKALRPQPVRDVGLIQLHSLRRARQPVRDAA